MPYNHESMNSSLIGSALSLGVSAEFLKAILDELRSASESYTEYGKKNKLDKVKVSITLFEEVEETKKDV
jgi:hypothetical protein